MTTRLMLPRFTIRHFSNTGTSAMRGRPSETREKKQISAESILEDEQKGLFRVLDFGPPKKTFGREARKFRGVEQVPPARSATMKPDQDWGNVWPAARTFHPAVVPLPVRQGVKQQKAHVVKSKWANAELMKIPNFLHLTPPVVSKHCAAISKFCTPWPEGLSTDDDVEKHFPITVVTSDHLNSSSSIRDRRSRIVTIRFKPESLELDSHAKDKFIRLVGGRYNERSGYITITTDRCPYRGQNRDYANYLLTALFHESWVAEDWEEKDEQDEEQFVNQEGHEDRIALGELLNQGEDDLSVIKYREEVRKMLGLPPPHAKVEEALQQ